MLGWWGPGDKGRAARPGRVDRGQPTVLPCLLRRAALADIVKRYAAASQQLPHRLLGEHLAVALRFADSPPERLLSDAQLHQRGLSFESAMQLALQNLAAATRPLQHVQRGLYLSQWRDGLDAERLLQPARFESLGLRGLPVVMTAHRDLLLVSATGEREGLLSMAACAQALLGREGALSAIPLCWLGDEWVPHVPGPDEPAEDEFRLLRLGEIAEDYRRQRLRLQASSSDDSAPFVANYSLSISEREPFSYSVWTKGVSALLPRSEWIALIDPDAGAEPQLCTFEALAPLLQPSPGDAYPPRYATGAFPSEAQQRRLAHS